MSQGPIIKPGRWRAPQPADEDTPSPAESTVVVNSTIPEPDQVSSQATTASSSSFFMLSLIGTGLGALLVIGGYFLFIGDTIQTTHEEVVTTLPSEAEKSELVNVAGIDIDIDNLTKLWFNLSLTSDQVAVLRRNIAVAEADKQSQTYQALMFALETKLKEQTGAKQNVAQQLLEISKIHQTSPDVVEQHLRTAIEKASASFKPDLVIWLERSLAAIVNVGPQQPSLEVFLSVTHQLFPATQ